jgi:erythromycin 12 hydroxylase
MLDEAPCVFLERYGVWFVARHADVARVLHDWATFSSSQGAALEPVATPEEGGVILSTNPPEHTRIRQAVSRDFTPRTVAALEPRIRGLASDYIEQALQEDVVDWISLLARPLPTTIMAELMGYPERHRDQYCRWAGLIFDSMGCPAAEAAEGQDYLEVAMQLFGFVGELAANREYVEGGWADRIVVAGDRGDLSPGEGSSSRRWTRP